MERHLKDKSSLDSPINGTKGKALVDAVESTLPGPEELAEISDMKRRIRNAVSSLNKKEQKVIIQRYGLEGSKPQGRRDIASAMGISMERVRQIEVTALCRLKKCPEVAELV